MKKVFSTLLVSAAAFLTSAAHASVITVSTAQSEFDQNILNEGWWPDSASHPNYTSNTNNYTGTIGQSVLRSFYTFDLSAVEGTVTGATLVIVRSIQSGIVNLGLWDVTSDAKAVNANDGYNAAIYNDLGSGINYGDYVVPTGASTDKLRFALNANALTDMNAASKYFTIGAAVGANQYMFAGSGTTYLELQVSNVPEPGSLALLGLGVAGLASVCRRKSAQQR